MDFSKLLTHPEKELVIKKLLDGDSPKDVSKFLKAKYSEESQKHLQLSIVLLQEFADSKLDIYAQLEKDISTVKTAKLKNKEVPESITNNKFYKDRLNELATQEVDIKKTLENCVRIIETRLEQVFDKTQQNPDNTKTDYILDKWMNTFMTAMDRYDKMINNRPDQVIQHNYTVQMIDSHITLFQDAIREVLLELDPAVAFKFTELLSEKLIKLKAPQEAKELRGAARVSDIKQLTNKINSEFEKASEFENSNGAE